jgi:hypothetical protein
MSSKLFFELSDHQQQEVSGGKTTLVNLSQTSFFSNLQLIQATGTTTATPDGASVSGSVTGVNHTIDTSAFSLLFGLID